jgi:hypothetical protein
MGCACGDQSLPNALANSKTSSQPLGHRRFPTINNLNVLITAPKSPMPVAAGLACSHIWIGLGLPREVVLHIQVGQVLDFESVAAAPF